MRIETATSTAKPQLLGDSIELVGSISTATADTVRVRVTIRNVAKRRVLFRLAACSLNPQLYALSSSSPRAVFDWRKRANPDPEIGREFCPTYLVTQSLEAGHEFAPTEYVVTLSVRRIAGDSLPSGLYTVVGEIELSGVAPYAQAVRVPAGTIQLYR